jgi:hypothetical protein
VTIDHDNTEKKSMILIELHIDKINFSTQLLENESTNNVLNLKI